MSSRLSVSAAAPFAVAVAATLPGAALGAAQLLGAGVPAWPKAVLALIYGGAVAGAAFLLAWATEAVQVDISAGFALALLALVAVLPEYAVDAVFAIEGGQAVAEHGPACRPPDSDQPSPCSLALANMTGANRLLVGVGWPLVVGVALLARARRRGMGNVRPGRGIGLPRASSTEVGFLAVASVYAMSLPLRTEITLIDAAILVGLFAAYTVRIATAPPEEPDLLGPAAWLGGLPRRRRRTVLGGIFVFAAAVVLLVAEHFADALVGTGRALGVSEFFLVQWVAPLASESPELIVASLYAWRLATTDSLGTLVASKVNQWTLLVGTLPILFAIAGGTLEGLPVEPQQRRELLLTAAQALFAVALVIDLRLSGLDALALLVLFLGQFLLDALLPAGNQSIGLYALSAVYLLGAVVLFWRGRARLPVLMRDAFRTRHEELARPRDGEPVGARVFR